MKKIPALLLALCMIFALAACGQQAAPATPAPAAEQPAEQTAAGEPAPAEEPAPAPEEVELVVFAAASMTETMTEIKAMYEAANPGVTITYNFDSSGTLKTQIQELSLIHI